MRDTGEYTDTLYEELLQQLQIPSALPVIPLYFAKSGKSASATGVLNSFTYLGSAVSSYGIGAISGAMGWNFTIWVWIGIAAGGIFSI